MSRVERERFGSAWVGLAALLVATTCSRAGRLEPAAPIALKSPKNSGVVGAAAPSASVLVPVAPLPSLPPAAPVALAATALSLPHFEQALAGLEAGTQKDHVRILWLGDSHTNADFMTDALRRKLGQRFGAGGPGLVRLGAPAYRHGGVKLAREGRWKVEPEPPSRRSTEGDTALGYVGLRTVPAEPRARIEARIDGRAVKGTVRYQLLFDLPPGASFKLGLGGSRHLIDARTRIEHVPGSPIGRLQLEAPASEPFELSAMLGSPRFYGIFAEGSEPGVVLDTSGIDGARVATALAWNPEVLAAELQARPPDLVALAYGTNEAFDNRRAEIIGNDMTTLVTRLRRGAPSADCLVVGPPDAAAPDFTSLPHVIEIEDVLGRTAARLGCGFFSLRAAMGGDGAFARWLRATPALARGDRIHLLPAGYEVLGEAVATALLNAYDARKK